MFPTTSPSTMSLPHVLSADTRAPSPMCSVSLVEISPLKLPSIRTFPSNASFPSNCDPRPSSALSSPLLTYASRVGCMSFVASASSVQGGSNASTRCCGGGCCGGGCCGCGCCLTGGRTSPLPRLNVQGTYAVRVAASRTLSSQIGLCVRGRSTLEDGLNREPGEHHRGATSRRARSALPAQPR